MKRIGSYLFGFALLILPVVSAVAEADTPAICLIGDHPGIPDSDAQTAALLVCDELRKQGISVSFNGLVVLLKTTKYNTWAALLNMLFYKYLFTQRNSHENTAFPPFFSYHSVALNHRYPIWDRLHGVFTKNDQRLRCINWSHHRAVC